MVQLDRAGATRKDLRSSKTDERCSIFVDWCTRGLPRSFHGPGRFMRTVSLDSKESVYSRFASLLVSVHLSCSFRCSDVINSRASRKNAGKEAVYKYLGRQLTRGQRYE